MNKTFIQLVSVSLALALCLCVCVCACSRFCAFRIQHILFVISSQLASFRKFYFIFIFLLLARLLLLSSFVSCRSRSLAISYTDSVLLLLLLHRSFSRRNMLAVACSISLFKRRSEDWTVAVLYRNVVGHVTNGEKISGKKRNEIEKQ